MPTASQPDYILRWVFEYQDGRRKAGMWGQATRNPVDSAWAQSTKGLARAVIEGKHVTSRKLVRLAECSGQDYRTFQWVATAAMPGMGFKGAVTLRSRLVGLKLLARDKVFEVNGKGDVNITPITKRQNEIQFASY